MLYSVMLVSAVKQSESAVSIHVVVTKLCPTLCDLMDCSPPSSSVRGISQARVLEWVAISFSRGSSPCRGGTRVSCIAGTFFTTEPSGWGNPMDRGAWYATVHGVAKSQKQVSD